MKSYYLKKSGGNNLPTFSKQYEPVQNHISCRIQTSDGSTQVLEHNWSGVRAEGAAELQKNHRIY